MRLKVRKINFETGNTRDVLLNKKDAAKLGQKPGERIIIKDPDVDSPERKYWVAIVQVTNSDSILAPGKIGILADNPTLINNLAENKELSVKPAEPPDSYKFIRKKIEGKKLNGEEINKIISDAVSGLLSRIEIASFITGVSINNLDNDEITALTMAEARSGEIFDFGPNVYDKHSTFIAFSAI